MGNEIYEQLTQAVIDGEEEVASSLAQQALDQGLAPGDILNEGLVKGIEEVGRRFGCGDFFLPELVQGALAMQEAVEVLTPAFEASTEGRQIIGSAVAGTVAGDLHEIGMTIVCSMLSAAGFQVTNLGHDVSPEAFVDKVGELKPQLLLLSALLTTTTTGQQKTIEALVAAGLRDQVQVLVGGAPVTQEWADQIGADGYAEDAIEAVALAKKLVGASA
jgi:corrinoid protein of di/trimethylamine methyltransferase